MWGYMSDKGQDQDVLITCCSIYGKQLLDKLCWTKWCSTTEAFSVVPVESLKEGSPTILSNNC